jgi:hypothetical protein
MSNSNSRYANLAQVFPSGSAVTITPTNPDQLSLARGAVVYTDALGICLSDRGQKVFYPWSNVYAAEVAS